MQHSKRVFVYRKWTMLMDHIFSPLVFFLATAILVDCSKNPVTGK